MADKTGTSGAAGRAPVADQPDNVRNVVLVGHSGAGKTTLVEALLVATGTIQRAGRGEAGATVGGFDEALAACRDAFGDWVAPLYLPVTDAQGGIRGLIGLLSERFYDYSSGSREERGPEPEDAARMEESRSALIEAIIQESEDESL